MHKYLTLHLSGILWWPSRPNRLLNQLPHGQAYQGFLSDRQHGLSSHRRSLCSAMFTPIYHRFFVLFCSVCVFITGFIHQYKGNFVFKRHYISFHLCVIIIMFVVCCSILQWFISSTIVILPNKYSNNHILRSLQHMDRYHCHWMSNLPTCTAFILT